MLRIKYILLTAGFTTTALFPLASDAEERTELEERLEELEDKLEGRGFSEVVRDLQRIKEENRNLRGEIEEINHEIKRLEQRQHSLYKDLDDRLVEIRRSPPGQGTQDATQYTPLTALEEDLHLVGKDSDQGAQIGSEDELYQQAFELLSDGLFEQARDDLTLLLEHYPDGKYAANALYWIAETYYAENNYGEAADHFDKVLNEHPDSNKVPDALLKLGYIDFEEDKLEEAMEKLQRVKEEHPETTAAELAQQRISDIRQLMPDEG